LLALFAINGLPRQSLRSFLAMTERVIITTKPYFYIQYSFFISQSLKSLRPSFLNKQERGKELAALVVPSYCRRLCILKYAQSLWFQDYKRQAIVVCLTSFTLQNKNTSAVQMRGFKENI
jgi:hypothetical protein